MRCLKLMTVAALAMASTVSLAKTQGYVRDGLGTGREPVSTRASNITPADTRSAIAPALPVPRVGPNAAPQDYLKAARAALHAGRTGEAQQALEMAETRALTGSVPAEAADAPDPNPAVAQIRNALHALGDGDRAGALHIVEAMAD